MRAVPLIVLVVSLSMIGCVAPTGVDLARECAPTEFRAIGPPLPPLLVLLAADRRPLEQSGRSDILGRTYFDESNLLEPIEAALIRVLARDLERSGVTERSGLRDVGQPYIVELELLDGAASYEQGPESLVLVFPVSAIDARCTFRLRLRDRLGRKFLDERFDSRSEGSASLLGGPAQASITLLAQVLREIVDAVLPRVHAAPREFLERSRTMSVP